MGKTRKTVACLALEISYVGLDISAHQAFKSTTMGSATPCQAQVLMSLTDY
jgi:hypothetical protein